MEYRDARGGGNFQVLSIIRNKMVASISKAADNLTINTGQIQITNLDRNLAQSAFLDVANPVFIRYTLRAGYGDDLSSLPVLSIGEVPSTSWSHSGGDTIIKFSLNEGVKSYLDRNKKFFLQNPIPKGGTIMDLFKKQLGQGLEIEFRPNRATVEADLKATAVEDSTKVNKSSFFSLLTSKLLKSKYSWFIENGKVVIYKIGGEGDLSSEFRGRITTLNLNTGLLSADVENSRDVQFQTNYVPYLKFHALFNPELRPWNFIEINEPRWPHLQGLYLIRSSSFSLSNKSGGSFSVSGSAIHERFSQRSEFFARQLALARGAR